MKYYHTLGACINIHMLCNVQMHSSNLFLPVVLIKRQMKKKGGKKLFALLFRCLFCLEKFFHRNFDARKSWFFWTRPCSIHLYMRRRKRNMNWKEGLTKMMRIYSNMCTLHSHTHSSHTFSFTLALDLFSSIEMYSKLTAICSKWNQSNIHKSYCLLTWHYYHALVIVLLAPSTAA